MTLQPAAFLQPNGVVDTDLLQSQKRLQSLIKSAVDKACKLNVDSKRLVHIVDSQNCGVSKRFRLSNLFPSSSCTVAERSSSASPSPLRQWALSRESKDRRRVTDRVRSLLIEWRADLSFEWRRRVASAVPVLEEALYREAKSKEEYTNPLLLESQLLYVLHHFEAGNGPFLLQGSAPLYSVKESSSSDLASIRTYILHQNSLLRGPARSEETFKQVHERARVSNATNSTPVSAGRPSVSHDTNSRHLQHVIASFQNQGRRPVNNNVIIPVKNSDSSDSLRHELRKVNLSSNEPDEVAESGDDRMNPYNVASGAFLLAHDDLHGRDERRRNTLGVMLQFKTANETTPQGPYGASLTNPGDCPKISTEESNQTQSVIVSGEVLDLSSLTDSRIREESSDNERRNPSLETELALDRHETISLANREQHVYSVGDLSVSHSSSSASLSTLSPTPAIIPSNNPSSSSSWMAQRQTTPPRTPQYGRRTLSKAMSTECCVSETVRQSPSLAVGPRTKVEVRQTTSRIQSEQCSTDRDASTSNSQFEQFHTNRGTPIGLSSSASEESTSRAREKGLKLPLRRFLAERDEYNTCSSRLSNGDCPWETWQEATEQLDGMCCVCMVGLKGAAFIPCGHTFCRRCSRELWRSRGTCPLCNKYIREILDIY